MEHLCLLVNISLAMLIIIYIWLGVVYESMWFYLLQFFFFHYKSFFFMAKGSIPTGSIWQPGKLFHPPLTRSTGQLTWGNGSHGARRGMSTDLMTKPQTRLNAPGGNGVVSLFMFIHNYHLRKHRFYLLTSVSPKNGWLPPCLLAQGISSMMIEL